MSIRRKSEKVRQNQQGIASFIVVLTLMLILSLIVVGLARIIQREQRQALDRNLSSRAYYAAESGINLAIKALATDTNYTKTTCDPDAAGPAPKITAADYQLDAASDVRVTCLTVDGTPSDIEYSNLETNKPLVIPVDAGGTPINTIHFEWASATAGAGVTYPCSAGTPKKLTPADNWPCNAPLLRVDLIPTSGVVSRASLTSNMMTAFLYPAHDGSGMLNFSSNKGLMGQGSCNAASSPPYCSLTVTGLGQTSYYMRIVSMYQGAKLKITPQGVGGSALQLRGVQATIDSTARAQDQTRRVRVRKSLINTSSPTPTFGLETATSICKRLYIEPSQNLVVTDDADPSCK